MTLTAHPWRQAAHPHRPPNRPARSRQFPPPAGSSLTPPAARPH